MKKLMIFLAIALMANAASAALLELTVNDQPWTGQDVGPSDIITVVWNNDVAGQYGGFGALTINHSNGEQAGDAWVDPRFVYPLITIVPLPPPEGFDVIITGGGYPTPTGPLAGWTFHVPDYKEASDIIIIDPVSGAFNNVYAVPGPDDGLPYVELHVTPEPMTIALLGLGGLLLVRRRK